MEDFGLLSILVLVVTGFIAGIINTMAGGGSNLTIPALMVMGIPADIANATNRVSVLFQSLTAAKGFKQYGKLDMPDLKKIIALSLLGGLAGAITASYLPPQLLKPILLGSMIAMAAVILFKPGVVAPPEGTPSRLIADTPSSVPMLLLAGFYGGFVQAGVGFILLAAIAGSLRFDLVRANAIKIVCTAAFTLVALSVFVLRDQVWWIPGLMLAAGSMVGAHLAVKITLNLSQNALKWFLFIMTIVASTAALLS